MRKAYLYTIFYLLASCKQNDPIEIKQIDSKEIVTILPSLKNPLIKDSICISIPSEFEVIKKSSEIIDIDIFYLLDGKRLLDDFIDYQVFNKNDKTKPIHSLMPYLSSNESIHILIKERNHLISKNDAKELLKKYNINRSIENLKLEIL
ncbi:hypothetical protein HYN56_23860 [Flavobacterium crocinum]|uniref:Lipoprotein n=1 Tax=Flavobacterium crocinum TaxID=2183896 RepID=A0A2S1YSL7_9FLAO|nr:hypothetical protein [Flavobacterium crocinum]AWK07100.1 hypothetical protein HYN56_23860 [Flavobacterium crocinum]